MDKPAKIYISGHRGLAGSAIVRALQAAGYTNLLLRTHAELDLTEQAPTRAPIVNLGTGVDSTIAELDATVRRALGATAAVEWDRSRPDGTPRKLCDASRMFSTGGSPA